MCESVVLGVLYRTLCDAIHRHKQDALHSQVTDEMISVLHETAFISPI